MKAKVVLSVLSLSAVTTSATAGFQGLVLESKEDILGYRFVCNVYASFSDDSDRLLSLGFASIFTQDGSDFYQDPTADSYTAPASFLIPIFPDLVYDTFVTIGVKESDEAPNGVDGTSLDPDYYGTTPSHIVGGWFNNSPANGQGDAANYDGGNILIGQFTTVGTGVIGSVTVFWQGDATGGQVIGTEASFEHPIPTPGALALLGVAGFGAGRRCRA